MILTIDIGNTQTVLGLFGTTDSATLHSHWRISTDAMQTTDELKVKLAALLSANGRSWGDIDAIVIASVVPRLTGAYEELAIDATGQPPVVVGPGVKTGMPIRYDNPHEVGADRIANSVAAVEDFGAPVIVVDFGTATTLDVVDAEGAYIGGAIAPGVETSAEALFKKAARLSVVDLEAPETVIGTSTRSSIQAGLVFGEAVMVDGLVRRIWEELGAETPVIATGGLAERMRPLCATITHSDVDLTLKGLLLIYARSKGIDS
ncbi:MAG: type III pantothenate kinase [Actinobacteria bacterium]|nr:type III pantothenate kinase [Actinomycetota bacterium]